jgi:type IV secretory pathway TrbD component
MHEHKVIVYQSLIMPDQLLHADRKLVIVAGVFSFQMIFIVQTLLGFISGVLFWTICLYALRIMAQKDPDAREVFVRYMRYKKSYPARGQGIGFKEGKDVKFNRS